MLMSAIAPHCPLGPIALASRVQVDATARHAILQEQSLDIHYNDTGDALDYLTEPDVFDYEDGSWPSPANPSTPTVATDSSPCAPPPPSTRPPTAARPSARERRTAAESDTVLQVFSAARAGRENVRAG